MSLLWDIFKTQWWCACFWNTGSSCHCCFKHTAL